MTIISSWTIAPGGDVTRLGVVRQPWRSPVKSTRIGCGGEFAASSRGGGKRRQKYCSLVCVGAARRKGWQ